MSNESIIMLVQWGIIGVFVLFHFLVGFARGTRKTLYYTIVSFSLTVLLLWGISFISIRIFTSPGALLTLIEKFTTIPPDIKEYLVNPGLSGILFAIIDIIVRVIAFIILYPLIKKLLTWLVFTPIWKAIFRGKDNIEISFNEKHQEFVGKKRAKHHSVLSRFGGASIGAFRGLVVAFIFLLPLVMLGGAVRSIESEPNSSENTSRLEALLDANGSGSSSSEMLDILKLIQTFDSDGIGQFTKNIKIGNKSLEDAVFDFAFTTDVVSKDSDGAETKEKLVISQEIKSFGQIGRILIEGGYLESGYDLKGINYEDNYTDIEGILNNIGNSNLVNMIIPIGVDIASTKFLPEILGFNPNDLLDENGNKLHTKASMDALRNLDWKNEADALSKTIKALLEFGSVEELEKLIKTPKLFLDYPNAKKREVAIILKEVAELQLLSAANLGVEFAIRQDAVLKFAEWSDTPIEYIQDSLAFVLSNVDFFIGEDGEIANIANLIDAVFAETFKDYDYSQLIANKNFDLNLLLDEETSELVSAVLLSVTDIELFMEAIPIGIDYVVYGLQPSLISGLTDEIMAVLDDVNFKNEFTNINDIYKEVITLGLGTYIQDKEKLITIVDILLKDANNIRSLKVIVNNIFEESEFINNTLDVLAEPLIERYVKNVEYKNIALEVVNSEFRIGTELVSLINIAESVYQFTTIDELSSLKGFKATAVMDMIAAFGGLDEQHFLQLRDNIVNLQSMKIAGDDILAIVKDKAKIKQLVIPEEADVGKDIGKVFDLLYEVAKPIKEQKDLGNDILEVNLAEILDVDKISVALAFTANDKDSVLLASLVEAVKTMKLKMVGNEYFAVPSELANASYDDPLWLEEINHITSGIFDLTKAFDGVNETFPLSVNNVKSIKSGYDIPAHVVTRFTDRIVVDTNFESLISSKVLRHNGTKVLKKVTNDLAVKLNMTSFALPDDIMEDGIIVADEILDILHIGARLFAEVTPTPNSSFTEVVKSVNLEKGLTLFNEMEADLTKDIGESHLFNGIFRDLVLNEQFHNYFYDLLHKSNLPTNIKEIDSGIFEYDYALDLDGRIKESTFHQLLVATQELELTYDMVKKINTESINLIIKNITEKQVDNFLEIALVHETVNNLYNLDNIGQMLGTIVSDMFDKDIPYIEMQPDADLLDENGLITVEEIKLSLKAARTIGGNKLPELDNLGMDIITNLIGRNVVNGEDDLNRLLKSQYISRILSRTLTSKTIKEMLITGTDIAIEDVKLTAGRNDYDNTVEHYEIKNRYLTEVEIYNLFVALDTLGLSDFTNMNISNQTLIDLTTDELNEVLDSMYLHEVISLILISQISDMPEEALEPTGKIAGFVKSEEIAKLIESLEILGVTTADSLDPSTLPISKLKELVALDSLIINRLISNTLMGPEMDNITIPPASIDTNGKDILKAEILNIIETLVILSDGETANIDFIETKDIEITVDKYDELLLLTLDDNVTLSPFVHNMLSTAILTSFISIEDDISRDPNNHDLIKVEELAKLSVALKDLEITDIKVAGQQLDIAKLKGLDPLIVTKLYGEDDDVYEEQGSEIVYLLTSKILITEIGAGNIPSTFYVNDDVNTNLLKRSSIQAAINLVS